MISSNLERPLLGLVVLAVVLAAAQGAAAGASEPATPMVHSGGVHFVAQLEYSRAVLTLSGNGIDLRREVGAGESLAIEIFDGDGNLLPDGRYTWELRLAPDAEVARELRARATRPDAQPLAAWRALSGTITLRDGYVVDPAVLEPGSERMDPEAESSVDAVPAEYSRRAEIPMDDDVAVGDRPNVEEKTRAVVNAATAPARHRATTESLRSDAAALELGASAEPRLEPASDSLESLGLQPAPRSIDPEGKNGRPRSSENSR